MKIFFSPKVNRPLVWAMGLFAAMFSSCLKEGDSFPKSDDEKVDIVELGSAQTPDSYTTSYQAFSLTGKFENDTTGFYVIVQYAGNSVTAPEDITVNLGVDEAALKTYIDENSVDYVLFDNKMVTYPSAVTIPKGSDRVRFRVTINDTTGINPLLQYALPLSITSSSYGTVTANTSTKIYAFSAMSPLDGHYTYKTSANTSLLPNRTTEVDLVTKSFYTVQLDPGLLGYYTNVVQYTLNPENNKITVTCPSLGVFTPQDTRSEFDPSTGNLVVYWKQGNGARTFEETLTYIGDR